MASKQKQDTKVKELPIKRLAPTELKKLRELSSKAEQLLLEIGATRVKEQELLMHFSQINGALNQSKQELRETYGDMSVDINTGILTEIPKQPVQDGPNKEN
jgi:hypothetical protein